MVEMNRILLSVVVFLGLYCLIEVVSRRVAPANPNDFLDEDKMEALKKPIEKVERFAWLVTMCILAAPCYAFTFLLSVINDRLLFPTVNAVYDGRRWEYWCGSGLMIGLALGMWIMWKIVRLRLGRRFPLYLRFVATRDRTHPKRAMVTFSIFLLMLSIPFGWAAWNNGVIVDERGFTLRMAWLYSHQTYDEVLRIERFNTEKEGDEGKTQPALRIEFRSAIPVKILENSKCSYSAGISEIAEYVSRKSSIPITVRMTPEQ